MVEGTRVAIIPARGGSKRIHKKNIIDFCGKPMLAWTIQAANQSGLFARVVVSTDDPEIAEVSREYGASVPFLRARYSDDITPVSMATIATLEQLRDVQGEEFDVAVQLMANCPLRRARHIADAFDQFVAREARSQISCFRFGWMNPWWAATLGADGRPTSLFPDAGLKRSQDLPPLYCPTGAVWIARVPHLISNQTYHTPDRLFCEMPWEAAVDIDDADDLRMAKSLFRPDD